ncbi:hypothetical protein PVK06_000737 [Gossypium arboreum]|uniref:Secreted protein n=1 Tax=Gossypium arboreum TaxID=29729 RepID=A0ABR0R0F7_GOSAR|nr:hypothetical protein PVK06_000737 [Gossypium arboreum]
MRALLVMTSMIHQCLPLLIVAVESLRRTAYQLQLLLRSHPVPFITATAAKSSQLNLECNGQAIGSIGEIVM